MQQRKVHLRRVLLFAGATAALAVGCAAADPVTIVLDARAGSTSGKWSSWETLWKQDIADFEKTHPNIHVEYRSDWDSQKITIEMAAGSAPDIFEMWGAFGYAWGQSGSLLDLNPFVKRDYTQADIQNFYPPQWDAGIVRYGPHAGERYGVPKYSNASVLYYNKDLFDQAGLGYPPDEDAAGRWTYDEMLAFAKKLTIKGSDGRTQRYGINFCLDCDGRYASFIWAYGGKVFNLPDQPDQYVMNQGPGSTVWITWPPWLRARCMAAASPAAPPPWRWTVPWALAPATTT
ncbi:MAG TPA: extracellular solute-binding protein [Limnochordia bacterium]|nr:extracellular solute-binding protein [Limnochordia bacterium]